MNKVLILGYLESINVVLSNTEKGNTLTMSSRICSSSNPVSYNPEDVYYKYVLGEPRFAKKAELTRLVEIWKDYNINDMNDGTEKQMLALEGKDLDYKDSLSYLEKVNLLEDDGHVYGSKYVFKKIPEDVVNELTSIVEGWEA